MGPKLRTRDDFLTLPWKNGGGTTLELIKFPDPKDPTRFLFRLSIAYVDRPGPFSLFEGIDRHLILLDGKGMKLDFEDGRTEVLERRFQMIEFAGEEKIDCSLVDGPTKDFNVMIDRNWGRAHVSVLKAKRGQSVTLEGSFLFQLQTEVLVEFVDKNLELTPSEDLDLILIRIIPAKED